MRLPFIGLAWASLLLCVFGDQIVYFNKTSSTSNLLRNSNAENPLDGNWSVADIAQAPFSALDFKSDDMINDAEGLYAYQVRSPSNVSPQISSFQIVDLDVEMFDSIDSHSAVYNFSANFIRFFNTAAFNVFFL